MEFTVRIADVNIRINSIFTGVFELCKNYLCDLPADFSVTVTPADILAEREKAKREAEFEGRVWRDFPDSYLETLAVYRKIAAEMPNYGALLMHGAAVGLKGGAYLFTAPSGVGKTTHTGFWLKQFPDAFIINGDKPILRVTDGGVRVYGTPWAGKEGTNRNTSLPLKAICLLERGGENTIRKVNFSDVFPFIIGQTYRPAEADKMNKTLGLIKKIGGGVEFYALKCNLDPSAANVAFDGMNNNG